MDGWSTRGGVERHFLRIELTRLCISTRVQVTKESFLLTKLQCLQFSGHIISCDDAFSLNSATGVMVHLGTFCRVSCHIHDTAFF